MNIDLSLFWDVDVNNIDYEKNSQFIINRVLLKGRLNDWNEIKQYYGLERIKRETLTMRYLDSRTLSFCSFIFDVPKSEFRCCNTPPSIKELWNY